MTAVYLLITLSPLAQLSSRANPFAQAAAGQCSGDCRLCGCSAERSAAHTCCCWQKKLAEAKNRHPGDDHRSCPTASVSPPAKTAGSCCSKPAQHADHETDTAVSAPTDPAADREIPSVSISTCPCGNGKDLTVFGGEKSQHIPFSFSTALPQRTLSQFAFLQPERLASRHGEPPDPPPRLTIS